MKEEEYTRFITSQFDCMKRKNPQLFYICIPILNENSLVIGFLKPITFDYKRIYPECIQLFGQWRAENPSLSNSLFEITDERTEKWLDHLILKRKDRLLFLIDDLSNNHIGHIAFSSFNHNKQSAEIDCVLRGVKDASPGIMTYALRAMIRFGQDTLKLKELYLVTNENNQNAINLYKRCYFKIIDRIPLFRKELVDEIRWDPDETRGINEAERFEVKMKYIGSMNHE